MSEQTVIPVAGLDLRQRDKEIQFRQRAIQEKLENLSCAIFVKVISSLIAESKTSLPVDRVAVIGAASIEASLVMGKTLYGVTAVRAEAVPPVKEASEPF